MRYHRTLLSRRSITFLLAVSMLLPAIGTTVATADSGLLAHWAFDEGAGRTAADSSGSGLHASLDRDGWVADGVYGSAVNGRLGRPVVGDAHALNPETITVALWVRGNPADPPKAGTTILEVGNRGDCRAVWGIYATSTGLGLTHVNDFGDRSFTVAHPPIVEVALWNGDWHHVAISAQQGSGRIDFFSDGHHRFTMSTPWAPEYEAMVDPALTIGAGHAGCPTKIFKGDLDDVRVYDQALTRYQIGSLMPPIPTSTTFAGPVSLMATEKGCFVARTEPAPDLGQVWIVDEAGTPIFGAQGSTCADGPGVTAWQVSWSAAGTYFVRSQFHSGAPYAPSDSELLEVVVHRRPTTVHVSAGPYSSPFDVHVQVTSQYSTPGGLVTLYETTTGSDVLIGTEELQSGDRTFFMPEKPPGTYTFRAEYAGNAGSEPSSGEGSITVIGGSVAINNGAATTADKIVTLDVTTAGVDAVQVSNDDRHFRTFDPYQPIIEWDITDPTYGGNHLNGVKTVWVRWRETSGSWSGSVTASIEYQQTGIPVSPPTVTFEAPAQLPTSGDIPVRASWSRMDGGTNAIFYDVDLSTDGGTFVNVAPGIDTETIVRFLPAGHTYQLRVRAEVVDGASGAWSYGQPFMLIPNANADGVTFSLGWKALANTKHWGGTARKSTKAAATATLTFTGRAIAWVSTRGTKMGSATVEVDGVPVATVNTIASRNEYRTLVWSASWASPGTHTVVIRALATTRVDVDGFLVLD